MQNNHTRIFIDFEAITSPFKNEWRDVWKDKYVDIPFIYTIGIYREQDFKTKTKLISFSEIEFNSKNLYDFLRLEIIRDVRELLGNDRFFINRNTTSFVAWDPALERKILSKVYTGVKIIDLTKGRRISLSRATNSEINKEYFSYFTKVLSKNTLEKLPNMKKMIKEDGAKAALCGYLLLQKYVPTNEKTHFFDVDYEKMLQELLNYSKDDVLRMEIVDKNYEEFEKIYEEWSKLNKKKNVLRKEIRIAKIVNEYLSSKFENDEKNITNIIKKINDNLDELNLELNELNKVIPK
ncbi:MAG: hypothetical protein NC236_01540 [Mycoplasma sp.]|nr:hypothetical protein [Mycoplasma sp.]